MGSCACRCVDLRQRALLRWLSVIWMAGLIAGSFFGILWPVAPALHLSYASARNCLWMLPLLQVLVSLVLAWGPGRAALQPFVFLRAAAFSWTAVGLWCYFHSAGWLLWGILLCTDILFFPFLFFLWLRLLYCERRPAPVFLCAAAAVAIGLAGYRLVMPFGAFLIESK